MFYSRIDAVNYALTYALSPNPVYKYFPLDKNTGGDCANFVSQSLYAGKIPMNFINDHQWFYSKTTPPTWSVSWAVAHSLFWTLKINYNSNFNGLKGYEVFDFSSLQLGDLVFFEDYNKKIFHSAIITSFMGNIPLISQHSFEARNIPYFNSWSAYKVHFIKVAY
ncbi:amidase domain-containing protein [Clostridium rectalis]|uniref:amidase domain-containing protein n=1 Tax=Clostridium rectalis TaxID=2040295 RepID=UPI001FA9A3EE|nr:amidase domain-containing protein [Clostridium rectalis]